MTKKPRKLTAKEWRKVFGGAFELERRKSEVDPRVIAARIGAGASEGYNRGFERQTKTGARSQALNEFREVKSTVTWLKPLFVVLGIIFLFIGPGMSVVTSLFTQLNPLMWVGIIFILLLLWRNQ